MLLCHSVLQQHRVGVLCYDDKHNDDDHDEAKSSTQNGFKVGVAANVSIKKSIKYELKLCHLISMRIVIHLFLHSWELGGIEGFVQRELNKQSSSLKPSSPAEG